MAPSTQLADRPEPETSAPPRTPGTSVPGERWPVLLAVVATAAAVAFTVHDIGDKSLWFDEGATVGLVNRPYGDFLWRAAHWELNQSAYYVAFSGWYELGRSEAFLRLLSAAFVVATVPALFLLGRRLFDARVGAIAALLLAVNSFAVQWGQQLRAYSMALFLVTLASLALVWAVERPDRAGRAVFYGAIAAVAVYAHFYAALVLAAHAVTLLLVRPFPRRLVLIAGGVVVALTAPATRYLVVREGDPLQWVGGRQDNDALRVLEMLAGGRLRHLVVYGIVVAFGALVTVRALRRTPVRSGWWRFALPAAWLVLPIAIAAIATATVKDLLVARFLIVVLPGLALFAALGICRLPWPSLAGVALGMVLFASLDGVDGWHRASSYEDWRGATAAVAEAADADDSLVVVPSRADHVFRYYQRRIGGTDLEPLWPMASDPPAGDQLWVIERLSQVNPELGYEFQVLPWRERHYELVDEERFDNVVVHRYRRR